MKNTTVLKATIGLFVACVAASFLMVSCSVPVVVKNPDGTTTTTHAVDPRLQNALDAANAANTATAPFNPWAYPIGAGLVAIGSITTWLAKRKDGQMLASVVKGVQKVGDEKVKSAIQDQAISDGVEASLFKVVKSLTSP